MCIESIFESKPLKQINQFCYFQCVKQFYSEAIIIKQIGISTLAIKTFQPTLRIRYSFNGKTISNNLEINYNYPVGLLKLTLSHNYELIKDDNEIIISIMYPSL